MLGMVGAYPQVGEQQLFPAWVMASPVWFHGHKNGIDIVQRLRVACLQNPALLAEVVLVEDTEAKGLLLVRPTSAPGLKRTCVFDAWLRIQIVGVKNQSLAFGIKNTSVGLVRLSRANHIVNLGNVEIAGSH